MPSTTATLESSIAWTRTDTSNANTTVSDNGEVGYSYSLTDGTGISGEVNLVWHSLDTLSSGATGEYDLTDLAYNYLGVNGSVSFSGGSVKALTINNLASNTGGYILVSMDSSFSGFDAPFDPSTEPYFYLHPQGTFMISNPLLGWDVDSANRLIRITNNYTGDVQVELGIVGQSG